MIVIADYKCGNIGSVCNMLKKAGTNDVRIGSSQDDFKGAEGIILPGVGSFDIGIANLRDRGLEPVLNELVLAKKIPLLGICLGMQLLLGESEEGTKPGLGWISGKNIRFALPLVSGLKVPHMGWNTVVPTIHSQMFAGQQEGFGFYFVHSYYAQVDNPDDVAGYTEHGITFTCALERENIWGVQFHPEKSHKHGLQLMRTFLKRCYNA